MEKFKIKKLFITINDVYLGIIIGFLLLLLSIEIFLVFPTKGQVVQVVWGWWVPAFVIFLIVLGILFFIKGRKLRAFSIKLSEEAIIVAGMILKWGIISHIEYKKGDWDKAGVILHTKSGNQYGIPGITDGFLYIKGFIEGHAKSAEKIGDIQPPGEILESVNIILSLIRGWKARGYSYSQRFDILKQQGYNKRIIDYLLGEAECRDINPGIADPTLAQIQTWRNLGYTNSQMLDLLGKQGFNLDFSNILLEEAARTGEVAV